MNWTWEHRNPTSTKANWAMRALFKSKIKYWYMYQFSVWQPILPNLETAWTTATLLSSFPPPPTSTFSLLFMSSLWLAILQGPKVSTPPPPYPVFTNHKTTGHDWHIHEGYLLTTMKGDMATMTMRTKDRPRKDNRDNTNDMHHHVTSINDHHNCCH